MNWMLCAPGREVYSVEKIISFVVENWTFIAQCLAAIVALVLFVCRKKPVKVVDSIYQELTQLLLKAVVFVEKPGNGDVKRAAVLEMVQEWLADKYPEVDFSIILEAKSK